MATTSRPDKQYMRIKNWLGFLVTCPWRTTRFHSLGAYIPSVFVYLPYLEAWGS